MSCIKKICEGHRLSATFDEYGFSFEWGVSRLAALASDELVQARSFCSALAKDLGADPLGTAPMYDEFLMVEFPLPWHRNVTETDGFPEAIAQGVAEAQKAGRRLQLQAFAPDSKCSRPGHVRLMHFSRPEESPVKEPFGDDIANGTKVTPFHRVEYVVPSEDVAALTKFLLFQEGSASAFAPYEVQGQFRDVFVCTHGARDACCGKFGAVLHLELEHMANDVRTGSGADDGDRLRVWRVNHIGGHRFAPTVIDLPSGRYWGGLVSGVVPAFVDQPEVFDELRPYLRGWTGLRSPQEQVAEAEAWRRIGPQWLTYDKWIWTTASETDPEVTTVAVRWSDPKTGRTGHIEMDVAVSHFITLPESCGKEEIESQQWAVVRYDGA